MAKQDKLPDHGLVRETLAFVRIRALAVPLYPASLIVL